MSTIAILLSAFLLSVIALGAFIWFQRAGLFERNSNGAEVIFATGVHGPPPDTCVSASRRDCLPLASMASRYLRPMAGAIAGHLG